MTSLWSQFFPPKPTFTEENLPSQEGKVFIVTGGASGVGFELCKILYHAGAKVYLAGRSELKAIESIKSIKCSTSDTPTSSPKGQLEYLDLNTRLAAYLLSNNSEPDGKTRVESWILRRSILNLDIARTL